MLCMNETDVSRRRSIWWLPCLLAGLAIASTAAGQNQTEAAVEAEEYAAARTTYRVINLGAGEITELPAINARGQVSFSLQTGLGSRGFFYDGTASQDLGTLGGLATYAVGLNNAGQVTGRSTTLAGNEHAFVWSPGSGMTDLGTLPGAANSAASAINNLGVVVGTSEGVPGTPPRAFRWSAANGMEDLGAFTPGLASFSSATALNDAGLIAGNSDTTAFDRHAFAWTRATGLIDIDTLGSRYSLPVGVAARGQVAGSFVVPGPGILYHAFLWTRASGMLDLGTAGGTESAVIALSPNAHAAGVINLANGDQHAMSWTRAGGMADLGTLGGSSSRALAVNNKGQIVGLAENASGDFQAFVWTAKHGMVDLNKRLRRAPAGLRLDGALAISDNGSIVASSNAGLVLLKPGRGHKGAHAVGPVVAADLVKVGASVDASVSFTDEDLVGTRSVSWSWGDGSGDQAGKVRESNDAGSASASHSYAAPGIYSVTATVVNRAGRSAAVSRKIIAYEPSGGIVGGSGAFMSPRGAVRTAPIRSGKATFSFVAPSMMSAKAMSNEGQLHFDVVGLSFRSENLKPVAVQGARGQFEGSGTINGMGDYKFTLATTAGTAMAEGERGRFSLKIWHIDPATKAEVVDYDNQGTGPGASGRPIVEGRIFQQ